jgi:hypothetical protein
MGYADVIIELILIVTGYKVPHTSVMQNLQEVLARE